LAWNDKVAKKYYDNLYKEFAVCDLKHYKSGNFSLRWRTESEVLSGSGETTCGNTRCRRHSPEPDDNSFHLNTVELPFAYIEKGESKSALVKVVLCDQCIKKLMYKRMKDKGASDASAVSRAQENDAAVGTDPADALLEDRSCSSASREQREGSHAGRNDGRRGARSRSPRDRHRGKRGKRRRSRSP